jgi:hypothetical protein
MIFLSAVTTVPLTATWKGITVTQHFTEHRGWVVNTPALFRGALGSNLGQETSYSENFSSVPAGKCCQSTIKLGWDQILSNLSQFIIHVPQYHSMLYSLIYWKSVTLYSQGEQPCRQIRHTM